MNSASKARLAAIVGGSGAGKSWLAEKLHLLLGERAGRLSLDNFYRDRSHLPPSRRARINYDDPSVIEWPLFERALHESAAGRPAEQPRYDFATHCRAHAVITVPPRPVMLVDGLWLLHRPATRRLFDLRIYLDCPAKLRLSRRIARDSAERGRNAAGIRRQFRTSVAPMHGRHVAPQVRWADLVLHQPLSDTDIRALHDALWLLLQSGSLLPAWMRETFRAELTALLKAKEQFA
ncbi:MAG: uridine kinase [Opitutae bacterium]|nr:uridine kinase [Opitutae bacterium]